MAHILVVDDEQHICELYSLELAEEGHEVSTLLSAWNILDKIDFLKPNLLILDVKLAHLDGMDLLIRIRNRYHDLPIIISSAYDFYRYDLRAFAADYYVVKSFDLTELKALVHKALEAYVPNG